jgi:hypothetical protein
LLVIFILLHWWQPSAFPRRLRPRWPAARTKISSATTNGLLLAFEQSDAISSQMLSRDS